ncbi:MAG TPA: hypothetical protein DD473_20420 [Planctomycetaceae bacterium]|nr:hypothetical protein [Planctomycetaceae bacterium]
MNESEYGELITQRANLEPLLCKNDNPCLNGIIIGDQSVIINSVWNEQASDDAQIISRYA